MRSIIKNIENYLATKDFARGDIKIYESSTTKNAYEYLNNHNIDMMLVDKNIEKANSGIDIAKKARKDNVVMDILLYSAQNFELTEFRDISRTTTIHTYPDKTITSKVRDLIDYNLGKWDDIIFLRGLIISEIINLELDFNVIFMKYFNINDSKKKEQFNNFILENSANTLEGKKIALKKIVQDNKISINWKSIATDVSYLQCNRNILAHCKTSPDDRSILIKMGTNQNFKKKDMMNILTKIKSVKKTLSELSNDLIVEKSDSTMYHSGGVPPIFS